MKRYNKALDFVALALAAYTAGKPELAAKHFAKAATQPDVGHAQEVIEASNALAFENQRKARIAAAAAKAADRLPKAAKRVKASEEEVAEDPVVEDTLAEELTDEDLELGADLVSDEAMEDELPQEELAGDLDELDEPAEELPEVGESDEEEDDAEDPADAFAAVLASMAKKATKK